MADEAAERAVSQAAAPEAGAQPLPPLGVSGVVLSKAQLLEALKVYLPTITDFSPLPDGQHFYILFSQDNQHQQP